MINKEILHREGVLISCDPESESFALEELRPLLHESPAICWLEDGLAFVNTGSSFDTFASDVHRASSVFIRHLAPVEREVALTATDADVDELVNAALQISGRLDTTRTFAVQARILAEGRLPYRRVTLNKTISSVLENETGATMECRAPEQVISVVCTPTRGFLGLSRTAQNLSAWPGGMHRFLHEDGQISRAEHKLLEAISVFRLALPAQGTALDMGASPGGWSRVLREQGLRVVAVDPAELDVRLRGDRDIVHIRKQIQAYLITGQKFDVIVNDMRMDALESVEILIKARRNLKPGGLAVLTLKLPKSIKLAHNTVKIVRESLTRLSEVYCVLGARQLYHNRSEVTVALQAG